MHTTLKSSPSDHTTLVLTFGWVLVLAKCALLTWAIHHWSVPIHPGWLVWPTLAFAALATGLWVSRDR
ncbi:MAG: hypothetical protein MUE42_14045 [Opitutaceae bacterium]|nr:hypothetical protein [Opitutaceae bacterium]